MINSKIVHNSKIRIFPNPYIDYVEWKGVREKIYHILELTTNNNDLLKILVGADGCICGFNFTDIWVAEIYNDYEIVKRPITYPYFMPARGRIDAIRWLKDKKINGFLIK